MEMKVYIPIEKEICDDILRDGEVVENEKFVYDGIDIEQFTVKLDGQEYLLNKNNGEWVYMYQSMKID